MPGSALIAQLYLWLFYQITKSKKHCNVQVSRTDSGEGADAHQFIWLPVMGLHVSLRREGTGEVVKWQQTDWVKKCFQNDKENVWHLHVMFVSYLNFSSGGVAVGLQNSLLLIVLFLDSWDFMLAGLSSLALLYSIYNFSLAHLVHNNHYMFG